MRFECEALVTGERTHFGARRGSGGLMRKRDELMTKRHVTSGSLGLSSSASIQ